MGSIVLSSLVASLFGSLPCSNEILAEQASILRAAYDGMKT